MKTYKWIYLLPLLALFWVGIGCSKQEAPRMHAQPEGQVEAQAESSAPTFAEALAPAVIPSATNGSGKLVRIATIEGIEKNAEFQRNLNIVNKQKQLVIALNRKLEETTNSSERDKLQASLDQALAKLNENNRKMTETYGFTLARNYSMVVEQSQIFMAVTADEAERFANK